MIKIIKGFVTTDSLIRNQPGEVSPFGELSTWSMTYAKEKKEYHDPEISGHKLFVFSSKDDITGEQYDLPQTLVNQTISVVRRCLEFSTVNLQPLSPVDLRNDLLAYFNTPNTQVATIEMGPFVSSGPLAVPQWISWTSVNHDQSFCKIWLSDEAFSNQYDEYEIVVMPPVTPIDNLHLTYQHAKAHVEARTQQLLAEQIQSSRGRYPETYLRLYDFDLIDQIDPTRVIKTTWAFLIYSRAGDNIDSIKDALTTYIANNTAKTQEEWRVLFPSIYRRTEFCVFPRWDLVSIPNLSNLSSLYSGISDPNELLTFIENAASYYPAIHTKQRVRFLPLDYKALSICVVGGPSNVPGKEYIDEVVPDYIAVPSTSTDFGRMQVPTRNWINFIMELIIVAETATKSTTVPLHLRRIVRDNIVFISSIFENVHYLVAAKSNTIYL